MVPTGASGGEGFYGFVPAVIPNRDKGTITLNLALRQMSTSHIASR
jgi:hypothetical protein